ncbi:MAG TPA: MBL fold metallo-hydrolase [Flavobacteriales bacterium]|nr:MBL fold metallo-hydrolase [Flavobacteriales bacterium]HQW87305.1 MBL fold metallo-hydrolase [Flavobacteriales bacterium]
MLRCVPFICNPFQENTWLLHDGREALLVDPGCWNTAEEHRLEAYVTQHGLRVVRCLNTHGHIDHVLGNAWAHRRFGLLPEIHADDLELLHRAPSIGQLYGVPCEASPEPTSHLTDGDEVCLGDLRFEVIHVPGHSPGHVALYCRTAGHLVGGDVLFQGSIGRTDLPGGDLEQLLRSIRTRLLVLDDAVVVHSGHGPDTTIGAERRGNPFLQPTSFR